MKKRNEVLAARLSDYTKFRIDVSYTVGCRELSRARGSDTSFPGENKLGLRLASLIVEYLLLSKRVRLQFKI